MKWLKLLPYILCLIAIGVVTYYYNSRNNALMELLSIKNEALMQANLDLGRANTKIADANLMVEMLNQQIQDEIKKRQALLTLYAELESKYNAERRKVKTLVKVIYDDQVVDLPPDKLFLKDESGELHQVDSLTYSYSDFRIDIDGDVIKKELNYKLHQKFKVVFAESTLPTGAKNHYAELFELDDKNQVVGKMEITRFEVVATQTLPSKMMWWNPKVDIQLGGGVGSKDDKVNFVWTGDVGISLSAHGKTSNDIRWRMFRFGAGFTASGFSGTFSPVQLNLGDFLPLVSNLWLVPYIGYGFGGQGVHGGLGIGVVF